MPIMFPMAAFYLANQQLVQRIRVAYLCKKPPMMDNSLNRQVLNILKWAPVFMLFNGFWMLDNQQIFSNRWNYIDSIDMQMGSQHYFTDMHLNQSIPLGYLLLFVLVVVTITQLVDDEVLLYLGFGMYKKMVRVTEGLPSFKNAVPKFYLDRLQTHQNYLQETYNMIIL